MKLPSISFTFVLLTIMINMMGVGLIWPILPTLVGDLMGESLTQKTIIIGAISVIFSLMQFIFAPILGTLSDKFGRRPVMLICLLGLGVDTLLLALATNVWWLLAARALGGIFGASYSIASAYIADTSEPDDRAANFGLLGAAFGIGFIIGPLLGGLLGSVDIRLPFYIAAALSFANLVVGYFFLEESLPENQRNQSAKLRDANPFGTLKLLSSHSSLLLVSLVYFVANLTQRGMETIWILFSQHQYGWNVSEAGLSLAIVGASYFVVQGFLVGPVINRYGEKLTATLGMLLCACMFLILAFNTNSLIGYLGIPLYALGAGCAIPAMQSMASRFIPANQQGHLQGSLTALLGIAAIIGPALSSASFAYFTSRIAPISFAGAYFFVGAFIFMGVAWATRRLNSASENRAQ